MSRKVYGLVTTDRVRNGSEGYTMFSDAEYFYDYGPLLSEVVAEYLLSNNPYTPYLDGRIDLE